MKKSEKLTIDCSKTPKDEVLEIVRSNPDVKLFKVSPELNVILNLLNLKPKIYLTKQDLLNSQYQLIFRHFICLG